MNTHLTVEISHHRDTETEHQEARWSRAQKLLFRLLCAYLLLYNPLMPLDYMPFIEDLTAIENSFWFTVVPWVGKQVLGLSYDITIFTNASGDTTYNYVQVLCYFVLALMATLLWSLRDGTRANYTRLFYWLRVYLRFYVASAMMKYGAVKVIKTQFSDPHLNRLVQPIGEASPMGLLWTFMGFSEPYAVFTGVAEMLGGILLIFPQTALLGALISLGVLINIFVLNMSYDVPVKLYSSHLTVMCLLIAAPGMGRLANMFLFNRAVEPVEWPPLFARHWLNRGLALLRVVVVIYLVCFYLHMSYQVRVNQGDWAAKPPLYGIWNIEEYQAGGRIKPPLITDETRWRWLVFDVQDVVTIYLMDNRFQHFIVFVDEANSLVVINSRKDPNWQAQFTYQRVEPEVLTMTGTVAGLSTRLKLRRIDETKYPLNSRGFRWISEEPVNR